MRLLRERATSLAGALTSTQLDDGIWACKGRPNLLHSSRVFWALSLAKQSGITVHSETLSKAESRMKENFAGLSTNDNDAKAVLIHAFSIAKRADFAHMNRLAHQLKGAAPGFGFDAIGTAASVLEERLKTSNLEMVELDQIRDEFDTLIEQFQVYMRYIES